MSFVDASQTYDNNRDRKSKEWGDPDYQEAKSLPALKTFCGPINTGKHLKGIGKVVGLLGNPATFVYHNRSDRTVF